jgi:hypothetical protein
MSSAGRAVSFSVEELELELRGLLRGNLWLQVSTLCLHAQDVLAGAVVVEDTLGTLSSDVATVRALLTTEVFDASDDLAVLLPGVSSEEAVLEAIVAVAKQVCGMLPRPCVTGTRLIPLPCCVTVIFQGAFLLFFLCLQAMAQRGASLLACAGKLVGVDFSFASLRRICASVEELLTAGGIKDMPPGAVPLGVAFEACRAIEVGEISTYTYALQSIARGGVVSTPAVPFTISRHAFPSHSPAETIGLPPLHSSRVQRTVGRR